MSGGITLTGVATAVSAAAAAASAGMAISNALGAPDAGGASSDLLSALTGKASQAAQQRSSLLSTVGQSAGSPIGPGGVADPTKLFGN